ncbi:MAG: nitrate reductase [Verrucomicrobiota bacterium]
MKFDITEAFKPVLKDWEGPLTKELVQQPGNFGLGRVPANTKPDATTNMICGFCATGCGLKVHLKDGHAVNLSASTEYPVNLGMACPKGWEALAPLNAPDRATQPLLRDAKGQLVPVEWDDALQAFTNNLKAVQQKHGQESVAFLSTGQIPAEEMALLGSIAKFGMGIKHGDGNTRQCMATAVTAYKESFGFDAPPYTYKDFEESDVIILVGSNLCITHPIMWQRVLRNQNQPEIVVIDPRITETAMAATQHYAIHPKSDLYLFYGIAHLLHEQGLIKRDFIDAHTNDFEVFTEHLKRYTPVVVSEQTGISEDKLRKLTQTIADGKRVSFWWTMGVNQSHEGTRVAQAIINLALMTGNIGRPGTGANSITGQCNAMGSRLFSNTTGLLGGHLFENKDHRQKVANTLGIDEALIPNEKSWAYDQIIEGIANGKIKGLWLIATNSAHSWINQSRLHDLLGKLEFFVVQDMYHSTESAEMADLVLPAAGWGEKEGTFINSERRIGVIKKVAQAPGKALADFYIFKLIAEYWGCADLFADWKNPESTFEILKKITKDRPCDITGLGDYAMVDREGGVQWPVPSDTSGEIVQERRLFADGNFYHPDKKAKFIFEEPRPVAEPTCDEYPFILLTGRGTSSQWHTQTRTAKSDVLRKLYPQELYVEINEEDASNMGIQDQDEIQIVSRRGEVQATAFVTPTLQSGQVFMPMHYAKTNILTYPSFDPYSRQPSYKYCAVKVLAKN